MLDQLFTLSLAFAPLIALIPWIISIVSQSHKGRDVTQRRQLFII